VNDIAQVIGQRIRNYRNQKGLSQEKLAEAAGCHSTYIGQVERGEKNATIESIEKIARALDVPLSELFKLIGGEKAPDVDYAFLCYELVASKELSEQKRIYQIIMEIDKYKNE